MIVDVVTFLPCTPQDMIKQLKTPQSLMHVAYPLVKFIPHDPVRLPEIWGEETYQLSIRLFGIIPLGKHTMVFTYPKSPGEFSVRDNGYSGLCKRWDHVMTVEKSGSGIFYRDRAIIKAGIFTPIIWLFAQVFYRHRQRRWRQIAANAFLY